MSSKPYSPLPLLAKATLSFGVCLENGPLLRELQIAGRPCSFFFVSSDVDYKSEVSNDRTPYILITRDS
jgi:hypothetical protein